MTDKNKKENLNSMIEDKTQVLPTQRAIMTRSLPVQKIPNRERRQKGSCPFLSLLPKLGATSLLVDYEDDLENKLENLIENREEGHGDDTERKTVEISMLKQSLDWLKLRGV